MILEKTLIKTQGKRTNRKNNTGKRRELGGLCATCRFASTCIYPSNTIHPVVACEEFETVGEKTGRGGIPAKWRTSAVKRKDMNPEGLIGLCVDCEERENCMYARREGGVWHCEEYK
ncbi:MAG: hypothetical protein DRP87_10080 [Spirochaetes bacterium]|nr:MAG: hypothetical protein DRP87_10080 [Spirochaetota bacterium]